MFGPNLPISAADGSEQVVSAYLTIELVKRNIPESLHKSEEKLKKKKLC